MAATMTPKTVSRQSASASDPIGLYLNEIGRHPLLTPQDERDLARQMAEGKAAGDRLASERLTAAERRMLQRKVQLGERARERFVNANLRLVVSVAKKYQASGVPLLDLIQEGNLGLIRAVEKFDHSKGFRFSTYAVWWIRQFISRGIAASRSVIKLPSRANDELLRLRDLSQQFEQALGRAPEPSELAEAAGLPLDRVIDLLAVVDPVSLSTPVGEDGGAEMGDFVEDQHARLEVEEPSARLSEQELARLMSVLDSRERHILALRFGFSGREPLSVAEVAEVVSLSRERVRQLEHRAMAKLIHPSWRGALGLLGVG